MFESVLFQDKITLFSRICETDGKALYEKKPVEGVYFSECVVKDRRDSSSFSSAVLYIPDSADSGKDIKPGDIIINGLTDLSEPDGEYYTVLKVTKKKSSVPYLGYIKAVCS